MGTPKGHGRQLSLSSPSLPCLQQGRAQQVEVPMSTLCHAALVNSIQVTPSQSSSHTAQPWCHRTFSTQSQNPSWANTRNCSLQKKEPFGKAAFNRLPQHCAALAAPPGMLRQGNTGPTATHSTAQGGTTTLEYSRPKGRCNSLQALQTGTKVRWKKRILVGTNLTRQCPMKGESKKGNRNRGQREKSVRGSVMAETAPGPHGWMPTQSLQKKKKKKGYRAPKTFLIKKCVQAEVCQVILVLAVPAPPLSPRGLSLENSSGEETQGIQ